MKNIVEVLRHKEKELQQVQSEIDALRVAMRLMSEDGDTHALSLESTGTSPESRVREISTGSAATRQFP